MTSDAAARLRALLRQTPGQFLAVVDSVQADGSLNLSWGGTVIPGVPASSGYPVEVRKPGQTVAVMTFAEGWLVIGSAGTSEALPTADLSDYATKDDLDGLDIPREVDMSWGIGSPSGSGWVEAEKVWLRATGSKLYVYGQRTSSAPAPDPKDPKPPKRPDPVTTTPTATGAWRDGKREPSQPPRQSKYSSSFGPYMGAWFFGNAAAHAAGKSLNQMSITLTRSKSANGIAGGARVRLYLTAASRPGSSPPSRYSSVWSPGTLARGERKTWTLPAVWAQHLASGQAKGIVCYSTARSESIVFTTAAPLRMTFNAS